MKQYITENQFNKLSDKAQEALKNWTVEKEYPADEYPHLSIGQLMEFLVERIKDIHIERFNGGKKYSHWDVSTCYDEGWKFGQEQKELCDALWEAVQKELRGYGNDRKRLFKGKSVDSLYKQAKKFNRK